MKKINYNVYCRNCKNTYSESEIESNLKKPDSVNLEKTTEFIMMIVLENTRFRDGTTCKYCNATNVAISNITIDNKILYNELELQKNHWHDDVFFFTLTISKFNSEFQLETGGNPEIPMMYLWDALGEVYKRVKKRGGQHFQSETNGKFFIAISGNYYKKQTETFKIDGISKNEVITVLDKWIADNNIL